MIVILWCGVVVWHLKVTKSKYKNLLLFYGKEFYLQFLYINVLNYHYFHIHSSTLEK